MACTSLYLYIGVEGVPALYERIVHYMGVYVALNGSRVALHVLVY